MEGDLVTFSTQTDGGRWACDELLKAYFKDKDHPDLWPVLAIKTAYFTSPDYGRIAKPSFEIVNWSAPWAEPSGALLPASSGNGTTKAIEAPTSFDDELDDQIPF